MKNTRSTSCDSIYQTSRDLKVDKETQYGITIEELGDDLKGISVQVGDGPIEKEDTDVNTQPSMGAIPSWKQVAGQALGMVGKRL